MCDFVVPPEDGTARGARACIHDNCYDCCFEPLCCPDYSGESRARAGDSPARVRVLNPVRSNVVVPKDFEVIF